MTKEKLVAKFTQMILMKIPVDLEVYKALEARREAFSESHNDILRRALGLPEKASNALPADSTEETIVWRRKGVGLPRGTCWRMSSANGELNGSVVEGGFQYRDEVISSPSRLATTLYRTKAGKKTNVNGWRYIEVKRPGDSDWMMLSSLLNDD
jgi:negative regulator of replication initiation